MKLISGLFTILKLPIVLFLIFNQFFYPAISNIQENNEEKISKKSTFKKEKSEYILDSGDVISINFAGIPLFSNSYPVNPDGNIILPEINEYYVRGISIKELELNLNSLYTETIIDPDINIYIHRYRPVTIYLSGEIKRPGLYTLKFRQEEVQSAFDYDLASGATSFSNVDKNESMTILESPKVFDALVKGKGITKYADLSSIRIIRNNSLSNGGGKIKTTISILSLLETGDQSQNIILRDGDSIHVSKSDKIIRDQLVKINKTNLTPDSIIVYVSGNIISAGRKKLPQGSTLYEAIASSGGKKSYTGLIEYIKFDDFGNSEKKIIKYSPTTEKNKINNPLLTDGDIIIVRKNLLGKTTELLREVSSPILTGLGLYNIID